MAVAFDAQNATFASSLGSTTLTFITVGSGSNRALVVLLQFVGTSLPAALALTWDSGGSNQAMTQITNTFKANTNNCCVLYGLVNPVSGLKNLNVSFTGSGEVGFYAVSFTGVDQTGGNTSFPNGNTNSGVASNPATVTITSTSSNAIVACFVDDNTQASATLSDTQIGTFRSGTSEDSCANRAVGVGTHAMTATWPGTCNWAASGTDIAAVASGLPQGTETLDTRLPPPWGNPKASQAYPNDLRTWTQNLTKYVGKDALFTGPRPEYNQWLIPPPGSNRPYQNDLRWWTQNLTKFVGKDAIIPGSETIDTRLPPAYVAKAYQNDLRFWTENLVTTTLIVPVGNETIDTRLPPAYGGPKYPIDLRWWAQNNVNTTLGTVVVQNPFSPLDWPNPRAKPYQNDLRFWTENLVTTTLIEPVGIVYTDRPLPQVWRPETPSLNLLGTTLAATTPTTPAFVGQYDWPNPKANFYQNDLRTWTKSQFPGLADTVIFLPTDWQVTYRLPETGRFWTQSLVNTTLAVTVTPNPFQQYAWPNPRANSYQNDLRTWAQNNTGFIGQDALNPGKQLYDLTSRASYQNDLRTWTQNLVLDTLIVPIGIVYTDRPPAKAWKSETPSLNLLGTTLATVQNPFTPLDWPNPRAKPYQNDLRTFTESTFRGLTDAVIFTPTDWQVTYRLPEPGRFWSQSLLNTTLGIVQNPVLPLDWPNPRGPLYPIGLRYWTQNTTQFIGQDALNPPFGHYDWSLTNRVTLIDRFWTQNLSESTLAPAPVISTDIHCLPFFHTLGQMKSM